MADPTFSSSVYKLRRRIFDTELRFSDEELWDFICDGIDLVNMRTGEEMTYTITGYGLPPSSNQEQCYIEVARLLLGHDRGITYRDGQSVFEEGPRRSLFAAINEIVDSFYSGEVFGIEDLCTDIDGHEE